eukprot:gene2240-3117_t
MHASLGGWDASIEGLQSEDAFSVIEDASSGGAAPSGKDIAVRKSRFLSRNAVQLGFSIAEYEACPSASHYFVCHATRLLLRNPTRRLCLLPCSDPSVANLPFTCLIHVQLLQQMGRWGDRAFPEYCHNAHRVLMPNKPFTANHKILSDQLLAGGYPALSYISALSWYALQWRRSLFTVDTLLSTKNPSNQVLHKRNSYSQTGWSGTGSCPAPCHHPGSNASDCLALADAACDVTPDCFDFKMFYDGTQGLLK